MESAFEQPTTTVRFYMRFLITGVLKLYAFPINKYFRKLCWKLGE